jgi:hypothetical protein
VIQILSALGLSASTGLNAYLPLLIVGLVGRFTDWITLKSPWNTLENTWVLAVLGVLLIVEMTVDKIPVADTVNDAVQTLIRPAAGAVLFASGSNVISEISPMAAMICGLLVAGSVHAVKATSRPMITASTAGMGNPVISIVEDVISGISVFVSIVLPILAAVFLLTLLGLFIWWRVRWNKRQSARTAVSITSN